MVGNCLDIHQPPAFDLASISENVLQPGRLIGHERYGHFLQGGGQPQPRSLGISLFSCPAHQEPARLLMRWELVQIRLFRRRTDVFGKKIKVRQRPHLFDVDPDLALHGQGNYRQIAGVR